MTLFRYNALNEDGEQVSGTVDAADEQTARSALEDAHMTDIALTLQSSSQNIPVKPVSSSKPPEAPSLPLRKTTPDVPKVPAQETVPASLSKKTIPESSLISTLRLYAGWLVAWYGLVMALGYYSHVRILNMDIPFVEGLFLSPLVFSFLLATFLFLFMSTLTRLLKGGLVTGCILGIAGLGIFVAVKQLL